MTIIGRLAALAAGLFLAACAPPPPPPAAPPVTVAASPAPPPVPSTQYVRVPLTDSGGTPHVEVAIAGVCCFPFTVDSGAADVSVSPRLFAAMRKGGHVTDEDLIDVQKYRTANGVIEGIRFRMPPMTIGGRTVYGVVGSVSPGSHMMLLGQTFLRKFRFFAIDHAAGVLVLG